MDSFNQPPAPVYPQPVAQQPTPAQPVQPSPFQNHPVPPQKSSSYMKYFFIFFVFLLGIAGAFFAGKNSDQLIGMVKPVPTPTPTLAPIVTLEPTPTTEADVTAGWREYINSNPPYSVRYPSDWLIDTSKAELNKETGAQLTVYKGDYKMFIYWPTAYGPGGCIFSDHPEFKPSLNPPIPQIGWCQQEFHEFKSTQEIYRRYLPAQENQSSSLSWSILTKEDTSGYFVTVPPINYSTPKNYDQNTLTVMDKILSTFSSLDQPTVDTSGWKEYRDPSHNISIKYPQSYTIFGSMAKSLETWKAGEGITISNVGNSAKPRVFIEAVYDGYGPFFPTGTLDVSFNKNRLILGSIQKKTESEYLEMVKNGLVKNGSDLFTSKIIESNKVPFWFHISHEDHGNEILEEELLQILSTFTFTN